MSNKERKPFKESAQQAFVRGDWKMALECFQRHCVQEPKDLRSQLKIAELLERLGAKEKGGRTYRKVAEAFVQDGFLLQAISVNKMILRMDPSSKEVNRRLAKLYSERIGEAKPFRPFHQISLFSELTEPELQLLLEYVQIKKFPKDSLICREGDDGDSLYIIIKGEVAIIKRLLRGKEL